MKKNTILIGTVMCSMFVMQFDSANGGIEDLIKNNSYDSSESSIQKAMASNRKAISSLGVFNNDSSNNKFRSNKEIVTIKSKQNSSASNGQSGNKITVFDKALHMSNLVDVLKTLVAGIVNDQNSKYEYNDNGGVNAINNSVVEAIANQVIKMDLDNKDKESLDDVKGKFSSLDARDQGLLDILTSNNIIISKKVKKVNEFTKEMTNVLANYNLDGKIKVRDDLDVNSVYDFVSKIDVQGFDSVLSGASGVNISNVSDLCGVLKDELDQVSVSEDDFKSLFEDVVQPVNQIALDLANNEVVDAVKTALDTKCDTALGEQTSISGVDIKNSDLYVKNFDAANGLEQATIDLLNGKDDFKSKKDVDKNNLNKEVGDIINALTVDELVTAGVLKSPNVVGFDASNNNMTDDAQISVVLDSCGGKLLSVIGVDLYNLDKETVDNELSNEKYWDNKNLEGLKNYLKGNKNVLNQFVSACKTAVTAAGNQLTTMKDLISYMLEGENLKNAIKDNKTVVKDMKKFDSSVDVNQNDDISCGWNQLVNVLKGADVKQSIIAEINKIVKNDDDHVIINTPGVDNGFDWTGAGVDDESRFTALLNNDVVKDIVKTNLNGKALRKITQNGGNNSIINELLKALSIVANS